MRKLLLISGLAFASVVWAAIDPPIDNSEPEFPNVFYRLVDGKLMALDRQVALPRMKISGFIFYDATGVMEIQGSQSPIRFQEADRFDFAVKLPKGFDADPDSQFRLRFLDVTKRTREWLTASGSAVGQLSADLKGISGGYLPVKWTRYGTNSLLLSAGVLPPGEYGITQAGNPRDLEIVTFCFGVGPILEGKQLKKKIHKDQIARYR